jgi:hypothetical protein
MVEPVSSCSSAGLLRGADVLLAIPVVGDDGDRDDLRSDVLSHQLVGQPHVQIRSCAATTSGYPAAELAPHSISFNGDPSRPD